jgi:hypothetical protein
MKIFDGRHSSTAFQTFSDPTICLGRDEPRVLEMLGDDGFEKVLESSFETNDVVIRFYWRAEDSRARILFWPTHALLLPTDWLEITAHRVEPTAVPGQSQRRTARSLG